MASLALAFDILAKDRASPTFDKIGTSVDRTGTKIGRLGGGFKKFGSVAKVAMAGAATAVVAFGKSAVDAFVEAESQQIKLEAAYAKFPKLAKGNIQALRQLNVELAKKTRFDDDATAAAQAVLAQYSLTEEQIRTLTPLIQDYAARTGKDLSTAATDAGKAILGQGRAFKSIGLDLADTGSQAGNLERLMAGLRTQVGGFAEQEGQTAAGQAAILSNQFGELQEEVGSYLVPALLKLSNFIRDEVIPRFDDAERWIRDNETAARNLALVVGGSLVAAMLAYALSAAIAAGATIAATWPLWLFVAATVGATLATDALIEKFELMPRASRLMQVGIDKLISPLIRLIERLAEAVGLLKEFQQLMESASNVVGGSFGVGEASEDTKQDLRDRGLLPPEGRALGGAVLGGRSYWVGERGEPELLTMGSQSGFVTPASDLGGELHLHVTQLPGENQIDAGMRALRHHRRTRMMVGA